MVGLDDDILAFPFDPDLMRRATGRQPSTTGNSDVDEGTGIRLIKRLTIRDVNGGVVIGMWPAELKGQATFLYSGERADHLLNAATTGGWETIPRPHLSYFNAPASQRFYMTPRLSAREYAAQWTGGDVARAGSVPLDEMSALWPWLLAQRYASESDRHGLDLYLDRLARSRRPGHVRPGLRLKRAWPEAEVAELRSAGRLEEVLRDSVDQLLAAVGDPGLPAGE